jgi:hypothetical protein
VSGVANVTAGSDVLGPIPLTFAVGKPLEIDCFPRWKTYDGCIGLLQCSRALEEDSAAALENACLHRTLGGPLQSAYSLGTHFRGWQTARNRLLPTMEDLRWLHRATSVPDE